MSARAPLPLQVRAGWAVGTLVTTTLIYLTNTYFLRFLTDEVGMAAALAASLIAATKIVDAALNPLVGVLSDNVRSERNGRRRPFLLAGALLGGASLVMLFSIPATLAGVALAAWAFAALVLVSLAYVTFNVPYLAMLAEMTPDPHERAVLVSFRVYALAAAQFIAGLAPLAIDAFGGARAGHSGMGMSFAALVVLAGLICFLATRPAPRTVLTAPARERFWASLGTLFRSRLYVALVLVKATFLIGSTAHTMTATYYVRYVMQAPNATLSAFLLAYSLGMIVSQMGWVAACRRLGKVRVFFGACAIYATISVAWAQLGADSPVQLFIALSFVNGIGAGGLILTSESLLPDAIEDDCRRCGARREGTLAALFAFTEKGANALGVALVGFALAAYGYVAPPPGETIPPNVVDAIEMCFGLIPGFFVAISGLWWLLAREAFARPFASEPGGADAT